MDTQGLRKVKRHISLYMMNILLEFDLKDMSFGLCYNDLTSFLLHMMSLAVTRDVALNIIL